LRAQVEKLMQERVTSTLAAAAETMEDYGRRAPDTLAEEADALSETVRERPLVAVAVAAISGHLAGRITGKNTEVYSRERR